MSDTRNHTTRDQLADLLRENMSRGTSGRWIATYGITPEDFADTILASDAIAAVRAAAVAETTAAIEGILADWEVLAGYGVDEMFRGRLRAALSGGRTALDTCGHPNHGSPDHDCTPFRADTGVDQ